MFFAKKQHYLSFDHAFPYIKLFLDKLPAGTYLQNANSQGVVQTRRLAKKF